MNTLSKTAALPQLPTRIPLACGHSALLDAEQITLAAAYGFTFCGSCQDVRNIRRARPRRTQSGMPMPARRSA